MPLKVAPLRVFLSMQEHLETPRLKPIHVLAHQSNFLTDLE